MGAHEMLWRDPLATPGDRFPLGPPAEFWAESEDEPSTVGTRPFSLRGVGRDRRGHAAVPGASLTAGRTTFKIITTEGEALAAAALGTASGTMMAHPLALQLRNLQSLVEIGVDKNTTVVFPAPLMSTIGELGAFLSQEEAAAVPTPAPAIVTLPAQDTTSNGTPVTTGQ
jgi:hypothetical protein